MIVIKLIPVYQKMIENRKNKIDSINSNFEVVGEEGGMEGADLSKIVGNLDLDRENFVSEFWLIQIGYLKLNMVNTNWILKI